MCVLVPAARRRRPRSWSAGLVVLAIGENPLEAVGLLLRGALGSGEGIGFTLYYATNFIFTGLAVAVAFHAGPVQHRRRGAGVHSAASASALVCLHLDWPALALVAAAARDRSAAALFGAAWALIPAYLQAKRGSHIVITTIMFNFIAVALMIYLLVNVLGKPRLDGRRRRANFRRARHAAAHARGAGARSASTSATSPLNLSFLLALVCARRWSGSLIWRTRLGYEIRAFGVNPSGGRLCRHLARRASSSSPC